MNPNPSRRRVAIVDQSDAFEPGLTRVGGGAQLRLSSIEYGIAREGSFWSSFATAPRTISTAT